MPCSQAAPAATAWLEHPQADIPGTLSSRLVEALSGMRYGMKRADIDRYRSVFAAATAGDWGQTQALAAGIEDRRLIGHVLAARYLAPDADPDPADLRAWLDLYGDHPEADDIYRRATARKRGPDAAAIPMPRINEDTQVDLDDSDLGATSEPRTAAGERAAAHFYASDDKSALAQAERAIEQLGERASTSHWIAGLAAWRLGRFQEAQSHFRLLALSHAASNWMTAAGAYWAGRADEHDGAATSADKWYGVASRFPTTFYGLLALRKLGVGMGQPPSAFGVTPAQLDLLAENPAGYRALALLQIGRRDLAADELERIDPLSDPRMEEALIVVAQAANLDQLSPVLAQRIARPADALIKRRYPIPSWRPRGGFQIDPALVYAVARQESRFVANALSPSGAAGLMQIMPVTATYLAPKEQGSLFDPSTNLDVGQRYIRALMQDPKIGDNLLLLAVAYNAGSSNSTKFRQIRDHDDPLLAIESIPGEATRDYIKHVITNYWIYRVQLGGEPTSLTDLAEGRWPVYRWDDERRGSFGAVQRRN